MVGEASEGRTQRFRRGSGDGMYARGRLVQHGKPYRVIGYDGQLDAREGQASRDGVTERSVVPPKSGNADGGKGPQFETSVRSSEEREIG